MGVSRSIDLRGYIIRSPFQAHRNFTKMLLVPTSVNKFSFQFFAENYGFSFVFQFVTVNMYLVSPKGILYNKWMNIENKEE